VLENNTAGHDVRRKLSIKTRPKPFQAHCLEGGQAAPAFLGAGEEKEGRSEANDRGVFIVWFPDALAKLAR
jgi:hypothetical protein